MVVLGRMTAPYGLKGWLKLHPFGDDPNSWRAIEQWWLGSDERDFSGWRAYPLQHLRQQGRHWTVKLSGIDDRAAAESMAGSFFGSPREALPATAADEYYWADLLGMVVINTEQEVLGHLVEMIETGAHAVMRVADGEGPAATERLLPFVGAVVRKVDTLAGTLVVDWQKSW